MAGNALFAKGKKKLLDADIDLLVDDIKVVCVDHTDHTPDPAVDEFLSDIDAAARVATSGNLAGKSTTGGVFNADPITIAAVVGDAFDSLVIYKDTGVAGTSALLVYIDTGAGLPCTPDGSDITITWDVGAEKIFAL